MIAKLKAATLTYRVDTREKLAFIVLNWIDLSLTLFALTLGAHEMNPLMRSLFATPILMYAAKLIAPMFIAWVVPGKILLPSIALLVLVIGWNVKELLIYYF
jgi:hypothetical protein